MAIYYLHASSISRSDGRSAPGAAAYRAGERIRDERTGILHNHARRQDVMHKEIFLPAHLDGLGLEWAQDRSRLWNAAEQAEGRRNARVAREYLVALPAELSSEQRVQLARAFARELSDRHDTAVDLAVHAPRPSGDRRNYHAHLLETSRQVSAAGLGAKAGLDMSGRVRQQLALPPGIVELNLIRERWGAQVNEALAAAGVAERVDHRSLAARGIDREPMPHIPYAAVQTERRGLRSEIAERLREAYRQRLQQRLQRQQSLEAPAPQREHVAAAGAERSLEQIRQEARAAWLRLRQERTSAPAAEPPEQTLDDKGLAL